MSRAPASDALAAPPVPAARRVHRGHVVVNGIYFPHDDLGSRRAALAELGAGATVGAAAGGLVVQLARPTRRDVAELPGLALLEDRALLTAAALTPSEHASLREQGAVLVVPREGRLVHAERIAPVDPSRWLDLSEVVLEEPPSLGAPPRAVESLESPRPAREALGLAAVSAESEALRRALITHAASATTGPSRSERETPSRMERSLSTVLRALGSITRGLLSGLRALLGSSVPEPSSARLPAEAKPTTSAPSALARPRAPGWLARLDAWLRERLRSLGWRGLGSWLARKHAEHLQKLLSLLDAGDVDEALKHAIPLSDGPGGEGAPSLALPGPRTELAISNRRAAAGGALGLPPSLFQHLRARYRALFDRLVSLERWKDAAFVLAELLDDALGAVALLEKHGFLREAAELAEGRELPPAVVVRQWLVARDLERAIAVARRHDAFAPALARLRTTEREAARALALAWADARARSGDFLGALEALEAGSAIEHARGLALAWATRAAEIGGAHEGEALVWQLVLDGEALGRAGPRLEALLRGTSREGRHVRRSIFAALARRKGSAILALSPMARTAWRAAVRDRALFGEPMISALADLEALARDGTLQVDRPTIVPLSRARLLEVETPRVAAPSGTGAFEVLDAVLLPEGRVLVALGEAGLRVLARDGRTLTALDVPADEIVLSDEGTRALVVSRRGTLAVVHRVDTVARRAGDRFELAGLGAVARTFDGEHWAVVLDDVGTVLDVVRDVPRARFRLSGEHTLEVDRGTGFLSFVVGHTPSPLAPSGLERLRYTERSLVLRDRRALPERFGMDGRLLGLARFEPEPLHVMITAGSYYLSSGLTSYPGSREQHGRPRGFGALDASEHFASVVVEHAGRGPGGTPVVDVVVLDREAKHARLVVTIDAGTGASIERVGARIQSRRGEPPVLVTFDSRGRVLAVELEDGLVVADVGVR